ncbi:Pimeloyl-ACP methyl ester carboxylesterase [Desulfatibacillum alkenivorans DSM 16219]|jgi:pimeloyl-ACP methyl ester carboxylesterase|uniref:Pimeloyl-ACP methyl ester carboxylesterase n=1 Tax=Desulfatibacillum alkenivorans DSM 16219 TaxID=1121393 RepID=A0A1M6IGK6_9BACT|nr:alpha/beta hydrolase [Desulfatibacillum alkenivorans]SHJ33573.1 Pimeloyl-ACP methyl ester carboxylesterase [Desulfatibacillum alkenivorans DSM 16219]
MNLLWDRFVRVNGVRIHYTELPGPGEDVLLIHGFASSSYTWQEMAPLLHKQGYNVWALDLKGFGYSEKPKNGKYDPFSLMEDVVDWMDAVGLEKAVVTGNSLGGGIASLMALVYPEKVSKLVLLNALAPYDIPHPLIIRLSHFPLAPRLAGLVVTREVVRYYLKQVFFNPRFVTPEKVQAYYDPLRSPGCLYAQTLAARAMDPKPFLRFMDGGYSVKAPVLVIWGEDDRWIPLHYGQQLLDQQMGRGTFVVLPECGHMPQEEKPEDTAKAILDFMKDVPIVQVGDTPYCHVEHVAGTSEPARPSTLEAAKLDGGSLLAGNPG